MNSSLALIQKIKNIALASTGSFTEGVIIYPLLAFPLSEEDFVFLKDNLATTGETAKSYWSSKYQFALLANSIPKQSFIWNLDPDNLLYDKYKTALSEALLIAPGEHSEEEETAIKKASQVLFTETGEDSAAYSKYKIYNDKTVSLQKEINDLQLEINVSADTASGTYNALVEKLNSLQNELDDTILKWISIGHKLEIEKAKSILNSVRKKDDFVRKWQSEKNWMNSDSSAKNTHDEENANFFETSCTPNDFFEPHSKAWLDFELKKDEIENLIRQYEKEVPEEVTNQFGNLDIKFESIKFQLCILSIIRNWFKPDLLENNLWKFPDDNKNLSLGNEDDYSGSIPCYPVKLILIKNVSFRLSEEKLDDTVKNNIASGMPLVLGNLLMKPKHHVSELKVFTPQSLSAIQLKNIAIPEDKKLSEEPAKAYTKLHAFRAMGASSKFKTAVAAQPRTAAVNPVIRDHRKMAGHFGGAFHHKIIIPPKLIQPAEPVYVLSGKVSDQSNAAIDQVEISIQRLADGSLQAGYTDASGTFSLSNLINGNYHIRFIKQGYKNKEYDITISSNQNIIASLEPEKTREEYFVVAVLSKKLPKLPNPVPGAKYF